MWEIRQQREASRFESAIRHKTENPLDFSFETSNEPSALGRAMPAEILIGQEMPAPDDLNLLIRYDTSNRRQFQLTVAYLQELQRERTEKSGPAVAITSTKEGVDN